MSTLFQARVTELATTRAVVELAVVHPDAGPLNEDLVFAMRLLAERAIDETLDGTTPIGPLGDEVRFGEAESTSWCEANASRFIASFRLLDALPPSGGTNWRYPNGSKVRYELVVTEPRWLQHLAVDQAWDSTV
jgi:hypothetical protein